MTIAISTTHIDEAGGVVSPRVSAGKVCAPPEGTESGTWHWLERKGQIKPHLYNAWPEDKGGSWEQIGTAPWAHSEEGYRYLGPVQPFTPTPQPGLEAAARWHEENAKFCLTQSRSEHQPEAHRSVFIMRAELHLQSAATVRNLSALAAPASVEPAKVTDEEVEAFAKIFNATPWDNEPGPFRAALTAFLAAREAAR